MKHDRQYRRVLRTREDYLTKYKTAAAVLACGVMAKIAWDDKKEKRINEKLDLIKKKDENEEFYEAHRKWYYTLFDKRLWTFIGDFLNLSKINVKNEIFKNESNERKH